MTTKTRIEKGLNGMLRIALRNDDPVERVAAEKFKSAVDAAGAEFRREMRRQRRSELVEA